MTQSFYKFLNEVFEAKLEDNAKEKDAESQLFNTSMSKTFLRELGENLKSEVLEVILRIMARCIRSRSAYSNDMLHIAFDYEVNRQDRLPTQTLLFGIIKKTVKNILSDTKQKKDWYWMYVDYVTICLTMFLVYCTHNLLACIAPSGKTTCCSRVFGMKNRIPKTINRAFYGTKCSNGWKPKLECSRASWVRP